MQGDADQAALAGRIDRDGRERRRQQRAVLDDAQRPALLGDEEAAVGRLRERGRARQADDPALVAREAARLRRRCRRPGPAPSPMARRCPRCRSRARAGRAGRPDRGSCRASSHTARSCRRAPIATPSIWNSTLATATLSVAVAVTRRPARPLARFAGAVSATVGGTPSSAGGGGTTSTVAAALVVAAPRVSVARAVSVCGPLRRRPRQRVRARRVLAEERAPSKNSTLATPSSASAAVAVRLTAPPWITVAGAASVTVGARLAAGVSSPPPQLRRAQRHAISVRPSRLGPWHRRESPVDQESCRVDRAGKCCTVRRRLCRGSAGAARIAATSRGFSRGSGRRRGALRCFPSAPAPRCCRAGTGRSGSGCGSGSPTAAGSGSARRPAAGCACA